MEFVKFVTYIFYSYYSTGATRSVPYVKAVGSMVLLIFIHVCIALIVFNRTDLLPTAPSDTKGAKYLKIALYTLPLFLFFFFFVKEKDLQTASYDDLKVRRGRVVLLIYLVTSFALLIFFMFAFAKK